MRRAVNLSQGETVARCTSNSWQIQHQDVPADRGLLPACALRHLWVPLCRIKLCVAAAKHVLPPAVQHSRWSGGRQLMALGKSQPELGAEDRASFTFWLDKGNEVCLQRYCRP